jgi:prepilin-type N-terminal cleavage/methylation domain-containing protein
MKPYHHPANRRGFTLLEIICVLAVLSMLVGLLLFKVQDTLRAARVQQVQKTVETLKTALTDFISLPGGAGTIPRTEGTGIPTSGAALTAATDTAKGNAARLDAVLLAAGKIERPLSLRMGTQVYTSGGSGNEIAWSQALNAFVMTPDAAPLRDWSGVTRLEARTANPAVLPSAAQGANFRLDGVTNRSATVTVAYLVIPGAAAEDAYQLALAMNSPQLAPVPGAACDAGLVAYAAPVGGVTDLFIYVGEI